MSRIANSPVALPKEVEVSLAGQQLSVKGAKGSLSLAVHPQVQLSQEEGLLRLAAAQNTKAARALAGTFRSLVSNMVEGVSQGFSKALELQGVGYRAQLQGRKLTLSLGLSHPVEYEAPAGIELETPSQTQVLVKGIDKQQVGQVAAKIRAFRPPEPYKGKGVRYLNEQVRRKEAKKK